jgi:hypothetical protein
MARDRTAELMLEPCRELGRQFTFEFDAAHPESSRAQVRQRVHRGQQVVGLQEAARLIVAEQVAGHQRHFVALCLQANIEHRAGEALEFDAEIQALAEAAELLEQSKLVIKFQTFPFGRAAEAYQIIQAGHGRGKLVLIP